MAKRRPGFHSVPRWLFQANNLSTDDRFLLMYYSSHEPGWPFVAGRIQHDLGWGRGKYFKVAARLEAAGWIERETIYELDNETGKKVPVACKVAVNMPDLSVENRNSGNGPECRKPASSKPTHYRVSSIKGHSDFEVIDIGDVVGRPAGPERGPK